MAKVSRSLPIGTQLDAYTVEKILGGGGFGIVYLARHATTREKVVIKEYMPHKLAQRLPNMEIEPLDEARQETFNQGRKLFFNEANALANLKHPNIVDVLNFFQMHGTAYMVMRYESGTNLQQYIKTHSGGLSEVFMRTVFPQLLDGLKAIHARGVLHLDIKPSNIHLRRGGRPLLLDFGAVHTMNLTRRHQQRQVVTAGFSPVEQYRSGGYVGPWTDLYALGATMRACIEGVAPPPANDRAQKDRMRPAREQFKRKYSAPLLECIDWAMEVDPLLRPQSSDQLLERFNIEVPAQEGAETQDNVLDKLVSNLRWNR
jgi:serine/threonine protein kinase